MPVCLVSYFRNRIENISRWGVHTINLFQSIVIIIELLHAYMNFTLWYKVFDKWICSLCHILNMNYLDLIHSNK